MQLACTRTPRRRVHTLPRTRTRTASRACSLYPSRLHVSSSCVGRGPVGVWCELARIPAVCCGAFHVRYLRTMPRGVSAPEEAEGEEAEGEEAEAEEEEEREAEQKECRTRRRKTSRDYTHVRVHANTHTDTYLVVVEPNDPVLLCDEALDDCTHHALLMRQLIFALNVIRLLLIQGSGAQSQRQRSMLTTSTRDSAECLPCLEGRLATRATNPLNPYTTYTTYFGHPPSPSPSCFLPPLPPLAHGAKLPEHIHGT